MSRVEKGASDASIEHIVGMLAAGERRSRRSFSFTPPENVLSPLARVPFALDLHGRYFFDHLSEFGSWSFFGALEGGRVEQEVLLPMLREATGAGYVDVRPLSGLHCMTVAMAALGEVGDQVLTVSFEAGGHLCTESLARRLGMEAVPLPMGNAHDLDLDRVEEVVAELRPAAIYVDQSSELFPIDPAPLREIVERRSPQTLIHYDASHLNGLILTGAMFNPLARGAHSLGGSTHKTLPGPHKGYLATDDPRLAARFAASASTFVSHHRIADVVSLAITMIELRDCGGDEYGRLVIENARRFAHGLDRAGVAVSAAERGFTDCHQVWVPAPAGSDPVALANRLFEAGLVVNKLDGLPGVAGTAFRFSLAELTRMGGGVEEVDELSSILAEVLLERDARGIAERVGALRSRLREPRYCYGPDDLAALGAPEEIVDLCRTMAGLHRATR